VYRRIGSLWYRTRLSISAKSTSEVGQMINTRCLLRASPSTFLFILALLMTGTVWAEGNYICDQAYVLCTSAPCIPAPKDPKNKSICECVVQVGKSYGNATCEARKPKTLSDGTKMLISTYSFEQAPTMKIMSCPSGKPWSNYLDQPCTVDPLDRYEKGNL